MRTLAIATLLSAAAAATVPLAHAAKPPAPISVKLSEEGYATGDRAKVKVKAAEDGFLVILRADADGYVRVLFPVDPDRSSVIEGGKQFEVKSRGGREAFSITETKGSGLVVAAWSKAPFQFDGFVKGARWDVAALSNAQGGADPESALLDVIDRMATGPWEYDVATYGVGERVIVENYGAPWGPWWGWGWGWGYGWGPYWGGGFYYPYRPYWGRPIVVPHGGYRRR